MIWRGEKETLKKSKVPKNPEYRGGTSLGGTEDKKQCKTKSKTRQIGKKKGTKKKPRGRERKRGGKVRDTVSKGKHGKRYVGAIRSVNWGGGDGQD